MAYIVLDKQTRSYFLVDPADFGAIEEAKTAYGITGSPEAVLTTHKHWDHAGHNQQFVDAYPDIRIISGTNEPVYASNENLDDGSSVELLSGLAVVEAFETPCHTAAHNIFIVALGDQSIQIKTRVMFTGDCLFEGGVGQFFEGYADNMYDIFANLFNQRVWSE